MGNLRLPPSVRAGLSSALISPSIGRVSRKDGSPLRRGVPEYLVEPLEYNIGTLDPENGDIQLVDFGSVIYLATSCCFMFVH